MTNPQQRAPNVNYSLRPFEWFNKDSDICKACVRGDLQTMQQLCNNGNATPYDINVDGWMLLHIASLFAHVAICKWLLEQGVDREARGGRRHETNHYSNCTPLMAACIGSKRQNAANGDLGLSRGDARFARWSFCPTTFRFPTDEPNGRLSTIQTLVNYGCKVDARGQDDRTALDFLQNSPTALRYLLQHAHDKDELLFGRSAYGDHLGLSYCTSSGSATSAQVEVVLEEEQRLRAGGTLGEAQLAQPNSSSLYKLNLLHIVLSRQEFRYRMDFKDPEHNSRRRVLENLQNIASVLVNGISDLHGLEHELYDGDGQSGYDKRLCMTPLARIVNGKSSNGKQGYSYAEREEIREGLEELFKVWLTTLRDAGVDVPTYLQEERRLADVRIRQDQWFSGMTQDMEFQVIWDFTIRPRARDCAISASYSFRPTDTYKAYQENKWGGRSRFAPFCTAYAPLK